MKDDFELTDNEPLNARLNTLVKRFIVVFFNLLSFYFVSVNRFLIL